MKTTMKVERYLPADPLKPFIKHFMIIESADGMDTRILPDTTMVMNFRYQGQVTTAGLGGEELPLAGMSGLRKSARFLTYAKGTANLLVAFKEGGATAFFREPLHELFGASISLDNLVRPYKLHETEARLAKAGHNRDRIAVIEQFLLSQRLEADTDRLILTAIQNIQRAGGDLRIKTLLSDLAISRDRFEKRFRRVVGTSPKQFSAIVRFRHLITRHSAVDSLTTTAQQAGYFDQAHFIKDFKSFTGQTPKDFFAAPVFW
jgi:AraC-like DNA-binding protein